MFPIKNLYLTFYPRCGPGRFGLIDCSGVLSISNPVDFLFVSFWSSAYCWSLWGGKTLLFLKQSLLAEALIMHYRKKTHTPFAITPLTH